MIKGLSLITAMAPVYLVWIKAGSEVCQQVFEKPAVKAFFADEYGNSMAIAVLFAVFSRPQQRKMRQ